ncbi:MAG: hypothetical protein AAFX81_05500 [Pseudomonadota bacterium]
MATVICVELPTRRPSRLGIAMASSIFHSGGLHHQERFRWMNLQKHQPKLAWHSQSSRDEQPTTEQQHGFFSHFSFAILGLRLVAGRWIVNAAGVACLQAILDQWPGPSLHGSRSGRIDG